MRSVIIGAGSYGQVYLSYLRHTTALDIIGFLDDNESLLGQVIEGIPVLGTSRDLPVMRLQGIDATIVAIGSNADRVRLLECARAAGYSTPNYIHPAAIVSEDARIGNGVYVLPGAIVMPYAEIGDSVVISVGAKVAHHTRLGKGVFLSTGANMGAGVDVGDLAFVGIGATVMTGVKSVGAQAIIGAGAVVIRDVSLATTVAGVPAKPLVKS